MVVISSRYSKDRPLVFGTWDGGDAVEAESRASLPGARPGRPLWVAGDRVGDAVADGLIVLTGDVPVTAVGDGDGLGPVNLSALNAKDAIGAVGDMRREDLSVALATEENGKARKTVLAALERRMAEED